MRSCFVIQGAPARPTTATVELECIRADEIQHSGAIDQPMHERLED